jgi:hypothetical protein
VKIRSYRVWTEAAKSEEGTHKEKLGIEINLNEFY